MMLRTITSFCCGVLAMGTIAQLSSDKPVMLTAPFPEARQVTGLPPLHEPDAALSAAVERNGAYRVASPAPGNLWAVTLDALSSAPPAGTHLVLIAPSPTAGDVDVLVNGHGPYPLLAGVDARVDGIDVPEGTALSVVMDGTSFHVLNGNVFPRRPCPAGTAPVDRNSCIELDEHPATDFFSAILTCGDLGLRLCGWAEFISGCRQATELGLLQTTNNWEWTNDASNEDDCVRVVGAGSCLSSGNSFASVGNVDRPFRCCYTR
ncbi:MAG: hypothetical protein KF797_10660 [Flavobacteriales bacterium]|nr:hypothetical protein [Flavobacteriales bacterium]